MKVTMLVATYNRGPLLEQAFKALRKLTHPDEILVVDDGGTDDTMRICAYWMGELPVRYFYNNHPGETSRCHAMNCGLRLARYDQILTSDAEITFETDVVAQLMERRPDFPEAVLTAETVLRPERGPGGNVGLYERKWLMDLGGWDEALPAPTGYDDVDLHTRLARSGHVQFGLKGVVGRHYPHRILPMNDPNCDIEFPAVNQEYVAAKRYPADLVANKGKMWGELRSRNEPPLISPVCGGGGCQGKCGSVS